MLLKAKTRTFSGETHLELCRVGGKGAILPRPFDPYFYAPFGVQMTKGKTTFMRKILLSTLKESDLWHVSFPNTYALKEARPSGVIEGIYGMISLSRISEEESFMLLVAHLPLHC